MIGMCEYWLAKRAPHHINTLELIFPIPGHSYIPPDRVFAQIEKKVRAKETIVGVDEYLSIYQEHGTVVNLGSDECPVLDFKDEILKFTKPPSAWHFKFNASKRFILKRGKSGLIGIRGEPFYKSDIGETRPNTKKGKLFSSMAPKRLPLGIKLKDAKLNDVDNLLKKHFGCNWKSLALLTFYKDILDINETHEEQSNIEADPICEPHEPDIAIRI